MSLVGTAHARALDALARDHGLFLCVGCGKCAAVCPMATLFEDFSYDVSPRGVIERALLGLEMRDHPALWYCLTCDLCTGLCPAGVRVREFVEAARRLVIDAGEREHGAFCRGCGAYLWPRHTVAHLQAAIGKAAEPHLTLCPRCRRRDYAGKMKGVTASGAAPAAAPPSAGDGR